PGAGSAAATGGVPLAARTRVAPNDPAGAIQNAPAARSTAKARNQRLLLRVGAAGFPAGPRVSREGVTLVRPRARTAPPVPPRIPSAGTGPGRPGCRPGC